MATTPRIAAKVLERDDYRCTYCLAELGDEGVSLTIDHIIPLAWYQRGVVTGDPDVAKNLTACCANCNSLKRDLDATLFAKYLAAGHGWTQPEVDALLARVKAATRKRLPR